MNAIAIAAHCAHGVSVGQPCMSCLVSRADALADRDPGFRHMLREVRGSRYQTHDFLGSSRAPSFRDLLAEVNRLEQLKGGQ